MRPVQIRLLPWDAYRRAALTARFSAPQIPQPRSDGPCPLLCGRASHHFNRAAHRRIVSFCFPACNKAVCCVPAASPCLANPLPQQGLVDAQHTAPASALHGSCAFKHIWCQSRAVQSCSRHVGQQRHCSGPHSRPACRHAMDSKPRSGGLSGEEKRIFMDMVSTGDQ